MNSIMSEDGDQSQAQIEWFKSSLQHHGCWPCAAPDHASAAMMLSPEITRPIHADGRPMPTAEQPAATGKHVTPTRVIPTRVIPMGMDVPVSLPMMPLYAIVMGDSGRHKHQRANYSGDEANSV